MELVVGKSFTKQLRRSMELNLNVVSKVSTVWEENIGTQHLANSQGLLVLPIIKQVRLNIVAFN